jgi:protein-L-isoaspartate(D-aspartate) O-methyltransferase
MRMTTLNIELARQNMVEQQVRPWDVLDQRILDLIGSAPREEYVPAAYRNLAFVDMNLPIGHGQVMMAPKLEARILQELDIGPKDRILEIGTGTGYFTSLLAALGSHVVSVEIIPELRDTARKNLTTRSVKNVVLELGDGARGWTSSTPFDVIVLTGATPVLPDTFLKNLALNGRLFAVVGRSPAMEARLKTRRANDHIDVRSLFETDIPLLINAYDQAKFAF